MTDLWPQLPEVVASREYDGLRDGTDRQPRTEHAAQVWSPVGGRVKSTQIQTLVEELTQLAREHGYPEVADGGTRVAFDRAAARLLRERMDLDWAEAGRRDVWSFVSLVALPHLTLWRFGPGNRERWVASDLTRHTWARLWWQAVVFAENEGLLDSLSESDLNQLLERRSIGGDPRLVCSLAAAILAVPDDVPRRFVIRDATLRLRRWLAFLDLRAIDEDHLLDLCSELVAETTTRFRETLPT